VFVQHAQAASGGRIQMHMTHPLRVLGMEKLKQGIDGADHA